jgi:hypothetical protein
VKSIEEQLPFWTALGYKKTVEVPEAERLGFVILDNGGLELMLQSEASVKKDLAVGEFSAGDVALYADVDSIAEARDQAAAHGLAILIASRKTPYGAKECWARTADGQLLGFAEH